MAETNVTIREMLPDDYDAAVALWQKTEHLGKALDREAFEGVLAHAPGCSRVAVDAAGKLVGTVLVGQDGRTGWLLRLAVDETARGRGLGKQLVQAAEEALLEIGIKRVNILVKADNEPGLAFWKAMFTTRLRRLSSCIATSILSTRSTSPAPHATRNAARMEFWRGGAPAPPRIDMAAQVLRHAKNQWASYRAPSGLVFPMSYPRLAPGAIPVPGLRPYRHQTL